MSINNGVVVLADGVPARMRFAAIKIFSQPRKDPDTGFISDVNKLAAQVIELNGVTVLTIFETLAEKLIAQIQPYQQDPGLSTRTFDVTKSGTGYLTEYTVKVS